jgi:pimeloyl-ACP methyl ester carboxylesterase
VPPVRHAYVSTNGTSTYAEAAGHGSTLVFLHGAFLDHAMWRRQVARFSQSFRVVTYDLRGHGRTGPTRPPTYSVDLLARDLKGLLDRLDAERPVLCGLSLGGMVVQAFAARHPDRVRGLVLADTAASARLTLQDRLLTRVLFPGWMIRLLLALLGKEGFVELTFWLADWLRPESQIRTNADLRRYVRRAMNRMARPEIAKVFDAVYGFVQQDFGGIDVPALVVCGADEPPTVHTHARTIARRLRGASLRSVAGAGHLSNLEQPRAFNLVLARWLSRHGLDA